MSVYHPSTACPQKNYEFVHLFTSYLRDLLNLKLPIIIAGDINLNLLNPENLFYIDMFMNDMFECGLRPLITRPTRVNPNNPTTGHSILDHVWISEDFPGTQSYVFQVGITDHFPVCAVFSALNSNLSPTEVRVRPITNRGKETFSMLLANISIESDNNMNYLYGNYYNEVFRSYCISFPIMVSSPMGRNPAPWMTFRLKQCIKKKAKLYKMHPRGNISRGDYTIFKSRLTNAIRRSKALYYSKLFIENAKNQKWTWKIINGIISKKKKWY